jgi:hypothetical protein
VCATQSDGALVPLEQDLLGRTALDGVPLVAVIASYVSYPFHTVPPGALGLSPRGLLPGRV